MGKTQDAAHTHPSMKKHSGAKAVAYRYGADATRGATSEGTSPGPLASRSQGEHRVRSDLGTEADGLPDFDGTEEAVAALAPAGTRGP